ncbi:acetyltransferase, putative [Talaromyces stipitatus ATCC 10500]|uniref:Acetyltransferase, putative n=1 Tax=Talaromyces stipitatus (strain ATCC 10500 / CBS 375.48 / QM 6759 / NRRL 1006) TaxID=441959 RepID=B8M7A4_TALSN|nr:acetyltransferase, putative [Talaromyces stipitatus ATCC 10500]EED20324.1 acetyltransferase, putative [Talaromyces stipitatus ATCC 10500]
MATVAQPAPIANGTYAQENDQHTEHGPPRFTAVNGKDSTMHNMATSTGNPSQSNENADVGGANGNTNGSRQDENSHESFNASAEQVVEHGPQNSSPQTTPNGANRNKRKRSESLERQSQQQDLPSDVQAISGRSSEMGSEPPIQSEASNGAKLFPAGHEYSGQSSTGYMHAEIKDAHATGGSWQDYDSHLISQAQKAQNLDTSDAQLVEALQRETHSTESMEQKPWSAGPPSVAGESMSPYPQEKPQSAVQVGPKRKRVFSNRTKTGCLTCRRRKKKCDEQHPACNNCIRGGFVCEGYSSRSTWQKPSSSKGPVPLQSKDGYSEAANQYLQDINARHHERIQTTGQQTEVNKVRPPVVEDNENTNAQYLATPTSVAGNRNAWPKRSWPSASSHPPYMAEHMAKSTDYREVPPIHELSRDGQPKTEYHVVPSIRELSQQGPHPKPGMPIFQGTVDQRPPHPSTIDTSSPQAQARLALSIEHQLSARHNPGEDTERDKMIHGELYRPFDMQLVEDRDRCKSALWRFNNACNPLSGVSSKEQNRLLREIIIPPASTSPSGSPTPRPVGSIGQGAVVEAPFRCHYGFNIHIGEDVMISENCSMVDDCPINIGAHTWIGPNVTILGSMAHANMQERKGSQSRYQGRPVTIEEDCYVGANCTIYPGVRLRRGAYVAPGEVVKSDIVAYGFQGLKPSYM